ncbi:MAG: nitroreductase family protein [Enterocloster asparagiformis]|nr:nitroreductase family protein [Enterocloster asparagiformis]
MLKDLVLSCRSYRRFYQEVTIPDQDLLDMVDTARLTASAANAQALKFKIINTPQECAKVFPTVKWAAALTDWDGPAEGERPSAYIVIACDLSLGKNKQWDDGIAAQTIMLSAVEKGYGGCMIGSFNRSQLAETLGLDPQAYSLDLVLALGKPLEKVALAPLNADGSTTYYRDKDQVHHVPKRSLEDLLI